ncbi:hypothetical protein BDN70DRAFT_76954 [Pholiota conissans]|uniref:Uncharacterized protein n=1 Tax=Pholiota conissans TaxID=109636 RepID=A0A9P5YZB8_9AGAR|nr:hypothetical protein BDN70DRAFT_76954 [Pholiota conissans]
MSIPDPVMRDFGKRGTTTAIACGVTILAALGGMYFVDRDAKGHEGRASSFEHDGLAAMSSSEVSAAVSIPKPGMQRLHVHHVHGG